MLCKVKYLGPFSFYPSVGTVVPFARTRVFRLPQVTAILIYQRYVVYGVFARHLTRFNALAARFRALRGKQKRCAHTLDLNTQNKKTHLWPLRNFPLVTLLVVRFLKRTIQIVTPRRNVTLFTQTVIRSGRFVGSVTLSLVDDNATCVDARDEAMLTTGAVAFRPSPITPRGTGMRITLQSFVRFCQMVAVKRAFFTKFVATDNRALSDATPARFGTLEMYWRWRQAKKVLPKLTGPQWPDVQLKRTLGDSWMELSSKLFS